MNVTQLVFSPTGGTRKVVNILTSAWGLPVDQVDLTSPKLEEAAPRFTQEDVAVIAVPSFGGRVPALAARRIAKLRGEQTPCVIVCVYGNRAYEDTLVELQDLAQQSGFRVLAAVAAVAEHSIVHQYAAGRPDQQDRAELLDFGQKILEKLSRRDAAGTSVLQLPGNRPYKKAGGASMVPTVDKHCTRCGLCAENCPAQAISRETLAADSGKCISCMRCVAECPKAARKVNEAMVSIAALAIKKACSERKSSELYL